MADITREEIEQLRDEFEVLVGLRLDWLSIPKQALGGFEPSQLSVVVNTLLDAALPQIELLASDPANREKLEHIGLSKAPGEIGERESYPDYIHRSEKRVELKGLFVDNPALTLKRPPTKREPSARLGKKITIEDVELERDVLMVGAIQLQEVEGRCYPVIIDIGLFPMAECIRARDWRLLEGGGRWLNGIPQVARRKSLEKLRKGLPLTDDDYEEDTNFGKLKRIPYKPLQDFMRKHGAI